MFSYIDTDCFGVNSKPDNGRSGDFEKGGYVMLEPYDKPEGMKFEFTVEFDGEVTGYTISTEHSKSDIEALRTISFFS